MNASGERATLSEVAGNARMSELAAEVALDGRMAYGQIGRSTHPGWVQPSSYYYIGATIKGEKGSTGIFVSKTTGEPLPYPSDLSDVVIEWVN